MRWLFVFLTACGGRVVVAPDLALLDADEVTTRIAARVRDRAEWAETIVWALEEHELRPDERAVCDVIAVIDQESGFHANPVVPGLGQLVRRALDDKARATLGFLGPVVLERALQRRARGQRKTYAERIAALRTERDVDLLFRETFAPFDFESLNPITTAGSMQVSVRFAEELEGDARDRLYTREGGVYFGVARLLDYEAAYRDMRFRFADYNAGVYASRNAAFQRQVSRLTGVKLAEDGDVLAYDRGGDSATLKALFAIVPERQARRDAKKEKTHAFEDTTTYEAVKRAYARRFGPPAYAIVPSVEIDSVKLGRKRSTAWFAAAVDARYERCLSL